MRAQIAFLDHAQVFAEKTCIVGAGNHAVAAAYALRRIHHDHTVRPLIGGSCWANAHARRSFAVVALFRLEDRHQLWPVTAKFFIDPITAFAKWHTIFSAASDDA